MTTIQTIARNIFNGLTHDMIISVNTGKTRNSYALWEYNLIDGWKLTYKFIKMVSLNAVEGEYCQLNRVCDLTANWHTQATLTHQIMAEVGALKLAAQEQSGAMPFGKYKGTAVSELNDLSYVCWLANQLTKDEDYNGIDNWIKKAATDRAKVLGAIQIGQQLFDLHDDNRYNANTAKIYRAIQNNEPIEYVAEQNDGGMWCGYQIGLPTTQVGHSYYGVCVCLLVEGKAKKVKGKTINIYDYTVEDNLIQVNGFFVI